MYLHDTLLKNEVKILQTYTDNIQVLEEEFHQKITHTRIALCHAQVSAMIDALEQHVLKDVIDLEEICDAKRILDIKSVEFDRFKIQT